MTIRLVCSAHPPDTPGAVLDVLDCASSDGVIRLTMRREGKINLDLKFEDDVDGRETAKVMMADLSRSFRAPTEQELRTVPDLMTSVDAAEPMDAMLCIQWDMDGRDPGEALGLRNAVMLKAEAVLNEAGLLVDLEGASIGAGTTEVTFSVKDFDAAKALVWDSLGDTERAHNCRIFDEGSAT